VNNLIKDRNTGEIHQLTFDVDSIPSASLSESLRAIGVTDYHVIKELPEEIPTEADYSAAIQSKLDELAQAEGFDSIHTAASYADESAVKSFQDHGIMFREKRSLIWAASYEIMAEVKAGSRAMPTIDELLAELPF
jgi:hypothetical protein